MFVSFTSSICHLLVLTELDPAILALLLVGFVCCWLLLRVASVTWSDRC